MNEQGSFLDDYPEFVGKFYGPDPTETERESGEIIESEDQGPLKPGKNGHLALSQFDGGERMTAYDASMQACGEWHAIRREVRRLYDRGYVRKDGVLPNRAPRGRPHVDAYVITDEGKAELLRLGGVFQVWDRP